MKRKSKPSTVAPTGKTFAQIATEKADRDLARIFDLVKHGRSVQEAFDDFRKLQSIWDSLEREHLRAMWARMEPMSLEEYSKLAFAPLWKLKTFLRKDEREAIRVLLFKLHEHKTKAAADGQDSCLCADCVEWWWQIHEFEVYVEEKSKAYSARRRTKTPKDNEPRVH